MAEASENMDRGEGESLILTGPANWSPAPSLTAALGQAFHLGVKELYLYTALVLLWIESGKPEAGVLVTTERLKQILGVGFQHDNALRTTRKRLERVNLLKVVRQAPAGKLGRGGIRNICNLVDPLDQTAHPNRIRAGWSILSNLESSNNTSSSIKGIDQPAQPRADAPEINGVEGWEAAQFHQDTKPQRGNTSDPVEKWNGAHRLNYFLEKYRELHGVEYLLTSGRGVYERKIAALPINNESFKRFIDWVLEQRKLRHVNWLTEQLNDFLRSGQVLTSTVRTEDALKGEYCRVSNRKGGIITVVHQYGGKAIHGEQMLALDALEAGLIDLQRILELDLCPHHVLQRMGLL